MIERADLARRLRRNQTDAERVLWFRLRDRRLGGLKFKRQVPIDRYIVDFCCAEARVIVELDGGQHATRMTDDLQRTRVLEAYGYLVLHFWNNDILQNTDGVLEEILNTATHTLAPPHPNPLPDGEREKRGRVRCPPPRQTLGALSPHRGEGWGEGAMIEMLVEKA